VNKKLSKANFEEMVGLSPLFPVNTQEKAS